VPEPRQRVLLVGPLEGATGGVATFTETLLGSSLRDRYEFLHLDTTRTRAGQGKAATFALINLLYFTRQWLRLGWLLVTRRPRILHQPVTSGISFWKEAAFMSLGRLCGARVLAHLHGARFREFFEEGSDARRRAIRTALRRAHAMVVLSEGWQRYMREQVDTRCSTLVVANPVEPVFAAWATGFARDWARTPCTVLFMGRLALIKGILTAFEAIPAVHARAPGTRFIFAGGIASGGERAAIEEARARLTCDDRVAFPGLVRGVAKRELFAAADILILPSSHENLPIAVLEGMAAGLPLVVTPVGALPEFLTEDEHAHFVEPGDAAALADRIAGLAGDPQLRRRMGEANRAAFRERFEPQRVLDRIALAYEELLRRA
jgi:glycosyltransferase involved in cell wall biosynthesis